MKRRTLGRIGPVSALTIGGGGLGQVWGSTSREEAVATLRAAVDGGVTLIDMAPSYGRDGEAERVVGDTFGGSLPPGVRITTKHLLGTPPAAEVYARLTASLDASLERMKLSRVDIFVLHGMLDAAAEQGATSRTNLGLFWQAVAPAFGRLMEEGRIGAWGITGVGHPGAVIEALSAADPPFVAQCIANLLDSPGGMKRFDDDPRPRGIIATAKAHGVGVMGIRAVQAGALTSAIDRDLPEDHPEVKDFHRAGAFRLLAADLRRTPAFLAHQYALSMEGVDTVVLGVKNREELEECLAAEAAGPLSPEVVAMIDASVSVS
ncbi:MAG: aldo/keto reductase [Anaerolinea sp.]|nr:aldo/keto reductase [Anaerolinea sp.]